MLIFFSSPSFEQPSYKIILDLNHKISPINLFSVSEKKKLIGTGVGVTCLGRFELTPTQVSDVEIFFFTIT